MNDFEVNTTAQWGKGLIPTLNNIFNKLSAKIDGVNENLLDIKSELITKVGHAQDTADCALKIAKDLTEKFNEEFHKMKYYCDTLKNENVILQKHANHLDNYSRKNNLVIGGIRETEGETPNQCEQSARNFFRDKLKLQDDHARDIKFVRCHRLGRKNEQSNIRPRSIIVRFQYFQERQSVWAARTNLDDKTVSISENFCGNTEFNRRKLYPIYRTAKKTEKYRNSVSLFEDTLIVNSKPYNVNTIDDLPDDIHPRNMCEKSDEKCVVFGGMYSEYSKHSNWSESKFTYKGKHFTCLEQAYMYNKADINNDTMTAREINFTASPREIKRIGSAITMKNRTQWNAVKGPLMLELVRAKYEQNEELKQLLIATGNRKLGETGKDSFFSIGLPLTHPDVLNADKWKMDNQLGKALETVRRDLNGL